MKIVEALVVASPEPISPARLAKIVPGCNAAMARQLVEELNAQYEEQGRAFELCEVAGGYQLRTRPVYAGYLQQLHKERPLRLSRAALETLAVVSYKQPVTRAEVERVRGVEVGSVLRSLLERRLIRVAGHREVPGRPMLYATTPRFLEVFGLASLDDLPTLRELEELVPVERDEETAGELDASAHTAPASSDEASA
jgi:segregation and condensation protein B